MKRDIREIFKNEQLPKKKLLSFHEDEFLGKLNKSTKKEQPKPFFQVFKIAASIVLMLSVGYYFLNTGAEIKRDNQSTILVQVQQIEEEYLNNINEEWHGFIKVANDTVLVKKYKQKLKESEINYILITKKFKENPNSINILESLINNLQRRLQLVKDIKEHIKELNQKNTSNETIYL
jgi:hypothetical protein